LGGAHQTIAPLQGRGLISTSKLVTKYLDHLESWVDNNAILERMTAIENMGDKATVLQYINKLDSEFCANIRSVKLGHPGMALDWGSNFVNSISGDIEV
jgi:hypothetical protein